jgi:hypothetical protein
VAEPCAEQSPTVTSVRSKIPTSTSVTRVGESFGGLTLAADRRSREVGGVAGFRRLGQLPQLPLSKVQGLLAYPPRSLLWEGHARMTHEGCGAISDREVL